MTKTNPDSMNPNLSHANPANIQIGQLNLRIPGQNAEIGHRVAEGVSQKLAQQIPMGLQRQIGVMNLRISLPVNASEEAISDAIALAISNALKGRNHGKID